MYVIHIHGYISQIYAPNNTSGLLPPKKTTTHGIIGVHSRRELYVALQIFEIAIVKSLCVQVIQARTWTIWVLVMDVLT